MDRPADGYTGIKFIETCLRTGLEDGVSETVIELSDFDVFCRAVVGGERCGYWAECRRKNDNPALLGAQDEHGVCLLDNRGDL